MATTFKKGDEVKLIVTVPQGAVMSLRMDDDGNVQYLVGWTDNAGIEHERWFDEAQLVSA